MPAINTASFEEGTLVSLDRESAAVAMDAGWALTYASISRIGSLVAVHIEASFAAAAAAAVTTIGANYAPPATVTDSTGKFTLNAAGVLSYTGSTAAAGSAVAQFVYQAGAVSPS